MNDLGVIDNSLSRFGWRFVHVMCMGAPVDVAATRERYVPGEAEEVSRCIWEEKQLGAYHLALSWPAREVVRLSENGSQRDAVMWWVGERSMLVEGERATLREAVDLAGTLFQMRMGRSAEQALVRKLPKNATAKVEELELVEAGWVPTGFIVVI